MFETMNQSQADSEKCFTCPIFFQIPRNKIFQCKNGHSICENCSRNLAICSECRVGMNIVVRNNALEDMLARLLDHRTGGSYRRRNRNKTRQSTSNSHFSVIFGMSCGSCYAAPIRGSRFICITCGRDSCENCFSSVRLKPRHGERTDYANFSSVYSNKHIFTRIDSVNKDNEFQKLVQSRGGKPLFDAVYSCDQGAISTECKGCGKSVEKGYVCIQCPEFTLLCDTCGPKPEMHLQNPNHLFAMVDDIGSLLTMYAISSQRSKGWSMSRLLLTLVIGVIGSLLYCYGSTIPVAEVFNWVIVAPLQVLIGLIVLATLLAIFWVISKVLNGLNGFIVAIVLCILAFMYPTMAIPAALLGLIYFIFIRPIPPP